MEQSTIQPIIKDFHNSQILKNSLELIALCSEIMTNEKNKS